MDRFKDKVKIDKLKTIVGYWQFSELATFLSLSVENYKLPKLIVKL